MKITISLIVIAIVAVAVYLNKETAEEKFRRQITERVKKEKAVSQPEKAKKPEIMK